MTAFSDEDEPIIKRVKRTSFDEVAPDFAVGEATPPTMTKTNSTHSETNTDTNQDNNCTAANGYNSNESNMTGKK
jgi:hypothetical protein